MPRSGLPEKWTKEVRSYFLGWFMADGYIENHRHAEISSIDKQLIFDVASRILYTNAINTYTPEGGSTRYRLTFASEVTKFLISEGLPTGPKTGKEFIPKSISKEAFKDFLRGVMDGDGSNQEVKTRNTLYSRLVCANKEFLEDIKYRLALYGVTSAGGIHPHEGIWRLAYGKYDSVKIGDYMYDMATVKLNRKYNTYKSFKDSNALNEQHFTKQEKLGLLREFSMLINDGMLKKEAAKLLPIHRARCLAGRKS